MRGNGNGGSGGGRPDRGDAGQPVGGDGGGTTGNFDPVNIVGTDGDDTIIGSAGDDTLEGGLGDDVLSGGRGSDTFVYSTGDGFDFINGFDVPSGTSTDSDTLVLDVDGIDSFEDFLAAVTVVEEGFPSDTVTVDFGNGDGLSFFLTDFDLLTADNFAFV